MLLKNQLNQHALDWQIDEFTVFREYLQLLFLHYLYQEKSAGKIYFKGGTCLRLLYGSPRFSEDLDFSTLLSVKVIKEIINKVFRNLQKEMPASQLVFVWQGKKFLRYKIKCQNPEFKYPLNIKIDFSLEKTVLPPNVNPIKTNLQINFLPLVLYFKKEEILAEKVRAFLTRKKGRDIFDLWFLLQNGVFLELKLVQQKLKSVNKVFNQKIFCAR